FLEAEDDIRAFHVTGVQTCADPISAPVRSNRTAARLGPKRSGRAAGRGGGGADAPGASGAGGVPAARTIAASAYVTPPSTAIRSMRIVAPRGRTTSLFAYSRAPIVPSLIGLIGSIDSAGWPASARMRRTVPPEPTPSAYRSAIPRSSEVDWYAGSV